MSAMIKDYVTTLQNKEFLTQDVWRFTFALPAAERVVFEPGQYMILKIGTNYRQYSIATPSSRNDSFEIIVEMLERGVGSDFLRNLQVGDEVFFKGPAGVFVLRNTPTDKIFLATGTGIAPIMSMITTHLHEQRPGKVMLFFGLHSREEVYYEEELRKLVESHPEFQYKICLSQEKSLEGLAEHFVQGRVNGGVQLVWANHPATSFEYYICGSKGAVDSLKDYVAQEGVPPDRVFFERFTL